MVNGDSLVNVNDIAVIGMDCRFPGAKNAEEFWQNLRNGVESIAFFSDAEVEINYISSHLRNHPNHIKAAGVLEDVELFDAAFFGYSPREVEMMDPQARLFLETAWNALENAGYDAEAHQGRIGIYAGTSLNTYFLFHLFSNPKLLELVSLEQLKFTNHSDLLTTRVAYKLNLQGPAVTLQTACSTSLVAIHTACQNLLCGECDMALAGGVSIALPQKAGYIYQQGSIHSPDGHCRAFDAKAQGTLVGNGVGIVVLKRLADAIADGDFIHAVIKGSAINNDGALKVGYTAPSVDGQAKVIAEAQAIAAVHPETIGYVEAHGTATSLGDPIEVAALTQAFSLQTQKRNFCGIGSVKTNLGHLNAAAGVAGFIKTVLALQHKQIPPSLHFQEPNPHIDFANSPFYVNNQLREWKADKYPRRAGVSSFGIGGTNAHVILEEVPSLRQRCRGAGVQRREYQLLVLSAKTDSALETATKNLAQHLKQNPHLNLADVAYTLQVGRKAFNYRRVVVCRDIPDAVEAMTNSDPQRVLSNFLETSNRPVVFMFPGQGAQYVNMGRELYETEAVFREQVDYCCELLKPHLQLDLREILYPTGAGSPELQQTSLTQPALFVIEYALAKLWMAWGIQPQAMIGHSIGEYVAATLAGVFSLEAALALVAIRGRLMQELAPGAMLSVSLPAQEVESMLNPELSLAASNAPSLCVVSGTIDAIAALQTALIAQGVDCRLLHTSHAFHSQMMESILEPFTQQVKKVKLQPPQIPLVSNITGTWITAAEATDSHYWVKHLRQTVRFNEGIATLLQQPEQILLEVGPGKTLSTLAKRQQASALTSLRHLQEQVSDDTFLLNTLSCLWLAGVQVNWFEFTGNDSPGRIPLPTYPFERQRYWIEPQAKVENTRKLEKNPNISEWFYLPTWKRSLLTEKSAQYSCWLVFIDSLEVGAEIAQQLALQCESVVTVRVGEQFTNLGNGAYAINPKQPNDYTALVTELSNRNQLPQAIAHFWSLTPNKSAQSSYEWFSNCQDLGFYSLLFLAQALGNQQINHHTQILAVTNNAQEITGDEQLCPEKATVLGICKVISQEYPQISCRSIDLVIPHNISCQLLTELTAQSSDSVVAYRSGYRWVQTFEQVKLDAPTSDNTSIKAGGVYLITGGLGSIGLVLAEYIAQTVPAKLILIGFSHLPEKAEWQQWLNTHDEQDNISRKIRKIQAIEALGSQVLVMSADVASLQQMQTALTIAVQEFGEINGVIHAAGVKSVNTVQAITQAECEQQFYPKVQGLYVLEEILQGKKLDFCILISSLASVLGLLGKAAYPAAHIFIDTFAHQQNKTNDTHWLSINWDNWLIDATAVLEGFMTPQEACEAWRRILSLPTATQVIVSTIDLQARFQQWIKRQSQVNPENQPTKSLTLHSRPNLATSYTAPTNQIEQTITEIWQQLLGVEPVGIHDNFFELGGDSVLGVQFIARANQAGLKLVIKQVFEHQTIAKLAAIALTQQHNQAIQSIVTGSVPLAPIQHWFLSQNQPEPHYWNQSVMLEVLQVLDISLLEQVLRYLLKYHDALRLRFINSASGWEQVNAEPDQVVPLTYWDFSALSAAEQKAAMADAANELQASLNLSSGPLLRVALFNLGANVPSRLLVILHHLVVDVTSWQILLTDLQTAYQQLSQGQAIQLPAKTTAFKQWTEKLKEYASKPELNQEMDYWLKASQNQVSPLLKDNPNGVNTVEQARTVSVALSVAETQALLQEVSKVYRTKIEEILLTGLLQTLSHWTGESSLLIDLEGQGRDAVIADVDLTRTVGWFTTISPILLELGSGKNPGEVLQTVKEQVRSIPHEGIGYGVLRYLRQDEAIRQKMQALPQPEIIFLYLGQFEDSLPESSLFRLVRDLETSDRSPKTMRPHVLQLTGFIRGGQLQIDWTYSDIYQRSTIEELAQGLISAIQSLITHSRSATAGGYTPSDFSAAKISQKDLSKLLTQVRISGGSKDGSR